VADKAQHNTRYFLNSVDPELQSIGNVTPGTWKIDEDLTSGFLDRYAQSIDVTGEIKDLGQVHSVPSVFARPILFAQALRGRKQDNADAGPDVAGPLHQAVRAEWRGLLATFMLADYFGLSLDLKKYSLPELSDIPQKYEGLSGSNDNYFRIMLRSQLPKPESAWKEWNLLYCDGLLVGATSPWTVLYTPAQYDCPASIPWVQQLKRKRLDGGDVALRLFGDPVAYFKEKKSKRELRILDMRLGQLLDEHKKSKWDFKSVLLKEELSDLWSGAIKRELQLWKAEVTAAGAAAERFTIVPGASLVEEAGQVPLLHQRHARRGFADARYRG